MDILLSNILENGSIIASPSTKPDYNFHWTRDSAIIIKSLINVYYSSNNRKYLKIFNNYVNISLKHITYKAGEPKFYLDGKPYLKEWGRPQNDGPALRGLVCIQLLDILKDRKKDLARIINNDLNYTINILESPCFDLWEEIYGYHFYTRILQYKFLYQVSLKNFDKLKIAYISKNTLQISEKRLFDHFDDNSINSSYSTEGLILRKYDSSILLGLEHVDYVIPNFLVSDYRIQNYVLELIKIFNNEYKINKDLKITFLGRYANDKYFNGNPWIITTISLFHYYLVINKIKIVETSFYNFINFLRSKESLSEQIDKNHGSNISVEKLTWNYAELLLLINKLKNIDYEQYLSILI